MKAKENICTVNKVCTCFGNFIRISFLGNLSILWKKKVLIFFNDFWWSQGEGRATSFLFLTCRLLKSGVKAQNDSTSFYCSSFIQIRVFTCHEIWYFIFNLLVADFWVNVRYSSRGTRSLNLCVKLFQNQNDDSQALQWEILLSMDF